MKVCLLGTYESDYDRNRILRRGFAQQGVEVIEVHYPLWETIRHKTTRFYHPRQLAKVASQLARANARLARDYLRAPDHDLVLVGYLGHLDMPLARLLANLRGKPLVFDAFISLYDTLIQDRQIVPAASALARGLRLVDRTACRLADRVWLDTDAHIAYFARALGLDVAPFRRVLVGADDALFQPAPRRTPGVDDTFHVLHYSKFAQLHGVPTILQAAKRLSDDPRVQFTLVGGGQLEREVDAQLERLALRNVRRIPWLDAAGLRDAIQQADVCLGVFGGTDKARRVIPNKVYQCMAMERAIITGDGPGPRELLRHGEHALLCEMANPAALADAIRALKRDPALRVRLATAARALYLQRCTPAAIIREQLDDLAALSRARRRNQAPVSLNEDP